MVAIVLGFFLVPEVVYAENLLVKFIVKPLVNFLLSLIFYLLKFTSRILATLMYNIDITEAEYVILPWKVIRDITNVGFIGVLLAIAVMNIIGIDSYNVKSTMPKFIMAVVGVNFSKLMCGVILDFSNVMTATLYTFLGGGSFGMFGQKIPGYIVSLYAGNSESAKDSDVLNLINVVINNEGEVSFDSIQGALTLQHIFIGVMLGFILVLFVKMVVLFLVRIVWIWILVIASPIYFFGMSFDLSILGEIKGWWEKQFFNYAFLPVKIAAVLAAGLRMHNILLVSQEKNKNGKLFDSETIKGFFFGEKSWDLSLSSSNDVVYIFGMILVLGILYTAIDMASDGGEGDKINSWLGGHAKTGLGHLKEGAKFVGKYTPIIPHVSRDEEGNWKGGFTNAQAVYDGKKRIFDNMKKELQTRQDTKADDSAMRTLKGVDALNGEKYTRGLKRQIKRQAIEREKDKMKDFNLPELRAELLNSKNPTKRKAASELIMNHKDQRDRKATDIFDSLKGTSRFDARDIVSSASGKDPVAAGMNELYRKAFDEKGNVISADHANLWDKMKEDLDTNEGKRVVKFFNNEEDVFKDGESLSNYADMKNRALQAYRNLDKLSDVYATFSDLDENITLSYDHGVLTDDSRNKAEIRSKKFGNDLKDLYKRYVAADDAGDTRERDKVKGYMNTKEKNFQKMYSQLSPVDRKAMLDTFDNIIQFDEITQKKELDSEITNIKNALSYTYKDGNREDYINSDQRRGISKTERRDRIPGASKELLLRMSLDGFDEDDKDAYGNEVGQLAEKVSINTKDSSSFNRIVQGGNLDVFLQNDQVENKKEVVKKLQDTNKFDKLSSSTLVNILNDSTLSSVDVNGVVTSSVDKSNLVETILKKGNMNTQTVDVLLAEPATFETADRTINGVTETVYPHAVEFINSIPDTDMHKVFTHSVVQPHLSNKEVFTAFVEKTHTSKDLVMQTSVLDTALQGGDDVLKNHLISYLQSSTDDVSIQTKLANDPSNDEIQSAWKSLFV